MRILAIDPGTSCGWAICDNAITCSGVWDISIKRDESRGMRLIRLRNKLNEIGKVDLVVFEVSKNHMSTLGAEVAGEIRGLITTWCLDNNIEYKGINTIEVKKHATGKGNAKKDLMISTAEKKFNKKFLIDDEADAVWILDYAITNYYGSTSRLNINQQTSDFNKQPLL